MASEAWSGYAAYAPGARPLGATPNNTYISHAEAGRFGVGRDSTMRLLRAMNSTPSDLASEIEGQEAQSEHQKPRGVSQARASGAPASASMRRTQKFLGPRDCISETPVSSVERFRLSVH